VLAGVAAGSPPFGDAHRETGDIAAAIELADLRIGADVADDQGYLGTECHA
jgi:hypothetical protein